MTDMNSTNQTISEIDHVELASPTVIMVGEIPTRLDMSSRSLVLSTANPSSKKYKNAASSSENIPIEICQEILSRLTMKQVLNLQLVSKTWKSLTSTPHFLKLHLNQYSRINNLTGVLVEKQSNIFSREFFSFNFEAWKKLELEENTSSISSPIGKFLGDNLIQNSDYQAKSVIGSKLLKMFLSFSALGFVVLLDEKLRRSPPSSSCCVILNPHTREKVSLLIANEDVDLVGQVYGIFYHPILEDICVLWGQRECLNHATLEFKLLNLGSSESKLNLTKTNIESSCWRNIIPRLHRHHPRRHHRGVIAPVNVKDVLYWMVGANPNGEVCCEEAILAFDVLNENFEVLPHPGPWCPDDIDCEDRRRMHLGMQLLQTNNGVLALCEFSPSVGVINVWERVFSKKYESGRWLRKHTVPNFPNGLYDSYRAIGMEDSFLLVEHVGVGLYIFNIKKPGKFKLLETREGNKPYPHFNGYMCAHSPSFATMNRAERSKEVIVQVPFNIRRLIYYENVIY